jgi:hypothetical protein
MRIGLREELETAAAYSVLCHELAHIYLGHLGADRDGWWPYRLNLPFAVTEIEAEAVSLISSAAGPACGHARRSICLALWMRRPAWNPSAWTW